MGQLGHEAELHVQVPLSQVRDSYMKLNNRFMPLSWVTRTHVEPYSLLPAIQRAFQQTADLPVAHVRTMERIVIQSTARDQFKDHDNRRDDSDCKKFHA